MLWADGRDSAAAVMVRAVGADSEGMIMQIMAAPTDPGKEG
jgi:hypothetical protein